MRDEKAPALLRQRLTVLFKEILALNMAREFHPPLNSNRLSGAVYHELLQEENRGRSVDELVDLAVHITRDGNLAALFAQYDACLKQRGDRTSQQVLGIVKHMIPIEMENRDQVVADTMNMLKRFRLVRGIAGIKILVQARLDNHNQDVDELDFMHLT